MKKLGVFMVAISLWGGDMIAVRKSEERGRGEHDWLSTYHTFSFADYHDPKFMGFKSLRVINEDVVEPKMGFDTHPHSNMEILTYVIEGTLEHKDTMGNHSQIKKGEFQLMTAGTGIEHSEFNPSKKEAVHLLQIWILPEKKGLEPGYQQMSFGEKKGLQLIVSREGPLKIHQDAKVYLGKLDGKEGFQLEAGRHAWIQMVEGKVEVNGVMLAKGDGASVSGEKALEILGKGEFLLFDLK